MKNFWQRIHLFLLWHYRVLIRLCMGVLCCLLVLACAWQFWIIPHIQAYQGWLTGKLEVALGRQVSIGTLKAGWHGVKPYLSFSDFVMYNSKTVPTFRLQHIEARLAWWRLFLGEVHFSAIRLVNPNLSVRRDSQQTFWIAGIPFAKEAAQGDNQWLNWIWQQGSIDIENGTLSWEDETQKTAPTILNKVHVHMSRLFSRHELGIHFSSPQSGLTAPISLKSVIYGSDVNAFTTWRGEVSVARLQGDLARLWHYVPPTIQPFALRSATGDISAVKLKFDTFTSWQLRFQAQLATIHAQFREKLAPLKIAHFQGNIAIDRTPEREQITVDHFTMRAPESIGEKPARFFYEKNTQGYMLKANNIFLQSVWKLLPSLPQLARLTHHADKLAGFVKTVDLQWPKQLDTFDQVVGMAEVAGASIVINDVLDIRNINMKLRLNGASGEAQLSGESIYLAYPQQFVAPLLFNTVQLEAQWRKVDKQWDIHIGRMLARNADMALQLKGQYRYTQNNEDWLALQGKVIQAKANRLYAYLPRELGDEVLLWLKKALQAGEVFDTAIKVEGKLKDFPFADGAPGIFDIAGHMRNVVMEYVPRWPKIDGIHGRLHFTQRGMTIEADAAQTSQVSLTEVSARMPDMKHSDTLLISGKAAGKTANFLQFLKNSPLCVVLARGGQKLQAQGNGALDIQMAIPLAQAQKTRVKGLFQLTGNQLDFGASFPVLQRVTAKLAFTEQDLVIQEMRAAFLGGAFVAQGKTDKTGVLSVNLSGLANMTHVARQYVPAIQANLTGTTAYRAQLTMDPVGYTFDLSTDLLGVTMHLPKPLHKMMQEKQPLTLSLQERAGKQQLTLTYAKSLAAQLVGGDEGLALQGEIILNPTALTPLKNRQGLWLTGYLEKLNWHDWQPFLQSETITQDKPGLHGVDLGIHQLSGYGYQLKDVMLFAKKKTDGWAGTLAADNIAGDFSLQKAARWEANVQLSKLYWPWSRVTSDEGASKVAPVLDARVLQHTDLPSLTANIADLRYEGRKIGQLHAKLTPKAQAWVLNRSQLKNADGEMVIQGLWRYDPHRPLTQGDIEIKSQNVEGLLRRFGQHDVIHAGKATIQANLQWHGSPFAMDYASMNGQIKLQAEKGQFAQIDPGAGRLLGVLSLQALPRRITLDFRDIFTKGLAFDVIEGTSRIQQGIAYTEDLVIGGPAAQVLFRGNVNLAKQTQNCTVRIVPVLGDGLSIAAGALVNPLVGVGAFVLQRVFKDPIGQWAAYDYAITETWQDPIVTKIMGPVTRKKNDDEVSTHVSGK